MIPMYKTKVKPDFFQRDGDDSGFFRDFPFRFSWFCIQIAVWYVLFAQVVLKIRNLSVTIGTTSGKDAWKGRVAGGGTAQVFTGSGYPAAGNRG